MIPQLSSTPITHKNVRKITQIKIKYHLLLNLSRDSI